MSPTCNSLIFALRRGDDHDAREAQVPVKERDVGLVAAHPVGGLGDDDLEHAAPRVLQQGPDTGAQDHAVAGTAASR